MSFKELLWVAKLVGPPPARIGIGFRYILRWAGSQTTRGSVGGRTVETRYSSHSYTKPRVWNQTKLLERGWSLFFSRVAQGERNRVGVVILTSPWLIANVLEFSPANGSVSGLLRVSVWGVGKVGVHKYYNTLGQRSIDQFCGRICITVAMCLGHPGEERSRVGGEDF